MIYENKIDWTDPRKGGGVLMSTRDPFKSAVLDYQIEVEGELEDIIKRHLRNPVAFKTKYIPFERRVEWVNALIGETPDDKIWGIIKSLGKLRNEYSHSRFTRTEAGQKKIQGMTAEILGLLKGVQPGIFRDVPSHLAIITQAHFMVQCFFREINDALDGQGLPKAIPD